MAPDFFPLTPAPNRALPFICLGAAAVLYCGFQLLPREPLYHGKTAAQWFREFDKASLRHLTTPIALPSVPAGMKINTPDVEGLMTEPSAIALRALSTNAAVCLGRLFIHEQGSLARNYRFLYLHLPGPIKRALPEPYTAGFLLASEIGW